MPSPGVRGPERTSGVGVLLKVDAILRFLEGKPLGAGPTEVAEHLGMTKSTVYRLLAGLEEIGLVDAIAGEGRYKLGLRLLHLGRIVQERLRVRDVALPLLEELAEETGLTVYLCSRDGTDAVCIEAIAGRQIDILELRPGGRLPGYAGGAGQVMLLGLSDSDFDEYTSRAPFPRKTPFTLTDADQLQAARQQAKSRGYVVSREDVTIGIGAVAAPIFDAAGDVVASLSVAGLMTEIDRMGTAELGARVQVAAKAISQGIGFRAGTSQ